MPRYSNQSKCSYCGRSVRYRTYNGNKYALEGGQVYFVPNMEGDSLFINRSGSVIRGLRDIDGQYGHKVHDCRGEYANKKAALVGERV